MTTTTMLNRDEKFKLIQAEVVTTNEAAEILGVPYTRMTYLIKKGKLVPVKKTGTTILFLREDLENRNLFGKPAMAILSDDTEIKADSINELVDILQQTFEISEMQIKKLAKTGESFQPKWKKLEPLKGLIVKYIEE